jgi:membrane associated rhomboid family serine protease
MPMLGRIVVWAASALGLLAFRHSPAAVAACIVAILYGIFLPRDQESVRQRRRGARWP